MAMPQWLHLVERADIPRFRCDSSRESKDCECEGCRRALGAVADLVNGSTGYVGKKEVRRFFTDNDEVWEDLVRRRFADFHSREPRDVARRAELWRATFGHDAARGFCLCCLGEVDKRVYEPCRLEHRDRECLVVGCAECQRIGAFAGWRLAGRGASREKDSESVARVEPTVDAQRSSSRARLTPMPGEKRAAEEAPEVRSDPKRRAKDEAQRAKRDEAKSAKRDEAKSEPKRRLAVSKTVRQNVWSAAFGSNGEGACAVCRKLLTVWDFEVCHRISRANGGSDDYDNLFVGCGECNRRQGKMNLDEYLKIVGARPTESKSDLEALFKYLERDEAALDELEPRAGLHSLDGYVKLRNSKDALRKVRACLSDLRSGRRREEDFDFIEIVELKKFRERIAEAE